jgi:hypothetical protein
MGMEDREWYREKQIDWERGGLKDRNAKRHAFPVYLWWVLAALLASVVVLLSKHF